MQETRQDSRRCAMSVNGMLSACIGPRFESHRVWQRQGKRHSERVSAHFGEEADAWDRLQHTHTHTHAHTRTARHAHTRATSTAPPPHH